MLEKMTYINHLGEEIKFGEDGLYLNINDMHSYRWEYSSNNNRILRFTKGIQEKSFPIVVVCENRDSGNNVMNQLMEIAEKDVMNNIAGKIVIGDYYMSCFLNANNKENYDLSKGIFYATITAVTDNPFWIKEVTQTFNDEPASGGQNLDYLFDFPYDFTSPNKSTELINYGFADSDFLIVVYGEVTDPLIVINGHEYEVSGHIDDNEYLEIDSKNKTITLVQENGTRINWFSHRNKDSYIFEKIPSGSSPVLWNGNFVFSITLFEERSEPKWT